MEKIIYKKEKQQQNIGPHLFAPGQSEHKQYLQLTDKHKRCRILLTTDFHRHCAHYFSFPIYCFPLN